MERKPIRQGDVLLMPIDSVPENARIAKERYTDRGLMVMDGEVTGHIHVLPETEDNFLYEGEDGNIYIRADVDTELRHDCPGQEMPDHYTLPLAAGAYVFMPQCELLAGDVRQVRD
jgi:hypothetical protein